MPSANAARHAAIVAPEERRERSTSPGDVSGDAVDRDGAFTVRVYGGFLPEEESGGGGGGSRVSETLKTALR